MNRIRNIIVKLILLFSFSVLISLNTYSVEAQAKEQYYWPTKGWRTSTPEEQGMHSGVLADILEIIQKEGYNIDNITIIRNGYLVTDAYFYPFEKGMKHSIHSCTKSITSALVGIALEMGYIKDINQPILEFFPEKTIANLDERKRAITLKHLLTMTSGLRCRDSYLHGWVGYREMLSSADWAQYVLDLPMEAAPGEKFEYSNGVSHLLSVIIQKTTNMKTLDFARRYLFGPLGITDVEWQTSPQGVNTGWARMTLTPHDMAKIGWLYLNKGRWEEKQVVSAAWVKDSTLGHVSGTLFDRYGYQWWVDSAGYYMAVGFQGQFIFVIPEKNIVAVFTASLPESDDFYEPRNLLNQYIIPAAVSSKPVPANPKEKGRLNSLLNACSKAPAQGLTWISERDGAAKNGLFIRTAPPAFKFEYPNISRKEEITYPNQIMGMRTPEGIFIHAYLSDISQGIKLAEIGPKVYKANLEKYGTNVSVISNKEITLKDGTKAYRTDFEWRWADTSTLVTTRLVSAFKDGKWIHITTHYLIDPGEADPIVESLTLK